ncbi:MAG: hypothetical protein MUC48_04965 [Leptolyngbya sp. Prado105]|jgi:hypothetical protein|nr:hypothetical protein [Leptolyngbya sp. Prado105]
MESLKFAELIRATFKLNQSLLQLKSAQNNCNLAALELQIAEQSHGLAVTQYQRSQIALALARHY